MFNRIKQFFESVDYAGLKPSGAKPLGAAETKPSGWLAPIQQRIERYLNKGGSSDPLYLSNRTFMQKARLWLIIGVPSAALLGGLGLVLQLDEGDLGIVGVGRQDGVRPLGAGGVVTPFVAVPQLRRDGQGGQLAVTGGYRAAREDPEKLLGRIGQLRWMAHGEQQSRRP